jgi:hypothetical protein
VNLVHTITPWLLKSTVNILFHLCLITRVPPTIKPSAEAQASTKFSLAGSQQVPVAVSDERRNKTLLSVNGEIFEQVSNFV